jgi:hypothetical protein
MVRQACFSLCVASTGAVLKPAKTGVALVGKRL